MSMTITGTNTETTAASAPLYPLALKLAGERVLVVGGGELALHKTRELVTCGGLVHVVSPEWRVDFSEFDGGGLSVRRSKRSFEIFDLEGVLLVVSATDDVRVQERVAAEAKRRHILYNVVDVPPLCNFYVPAILRRGDLLVAVSTAGKSPLLAGAVRSFIGDRLGHHLADVLDHLGEARGIVRERFPDDIAARKAALERLLPPEAIDEILSNRRDVLEARYEEWLSWLSA